MVFGLLGNARSSVNPASVSLKGGRTSKICSFLFSSDNHKCSIVFPDSHADAKGPSEKPAIHSVEASG